LVQVFANEVLERRELHCVVGLGNAEASAKVSQRFWRITAPSQARQRRHARVLPAAHPAFLHKSQQLALAQQRVSQIQPVELELPRRKNAELFDEPVIKRT